METDLTASKSIEDDNEKLQKEKEILLLSLSLKKSENIQKTSPSNCAPSTSSNNKVSSVRAKVRRNPKFEICLNTKKVGDTSSTDNISILRNNIQFDPKLETTLKFVEKDMNSANNISTLRNKIQFDPKFETCLKAVEKDMNSSTNNSAFRKRKLSNHNLETSLKTVEKSRTNVNNISTLREKIHFDPDFEASLEAVEKSMDRIDNITNLRANVSFEPDFEANLKIVETAMDRIDDITNLRANVSFEPDFEANLKIVETEISKSKKRKSRTCMKINDVKDVSPSIRKKSRLKRQKLEFDDKTLEDTIKPAEEIISPNKEEMMPIKCSDNENKSIVDKMIGTEEKSNRSPSKFPEAKSSASCSNEESHDMKSLSPELNCQDEDIDQLSVLSKFIVKFAESVTKDPLAEDVLPILADHTNQNLKCIISHGKKFMSQQKRQTFTTEDFNKALEDSSYKPILGYYSSDIVSYDLTEIKVERKKMNIFSIHDNEVDLLKSARDEDTFNPVVPSIQSMWGAIYGVACSPCFFKDATGEKASFKSRILPQEVKDYYKRIIATLSQNNIIELKIILFDLKHNMQISLLYPYLVTFIKLSTRQSNCKVNQLLNFLYIIQSLLVNPYVYIGHLPYFTSLIEFVSNCLVDVVPNDHKNNHWKLRDLASEILVKLLSQDIKLADRLYDEILDRLEAIIGKFTVPLCSHYGAIVGITAFGASAIKSHLYLHLPAYMTHLNKVLHGSSRRNMQRKKDAHRVYNTLLEAFVHMMQSFINTAFSPKLDVDPDKNISSSILDVYAVVCSKEVSNYKALNVAKSCRDMKEVFVMYSMLYEYFGDAFANFLSVPYSNTTVLLQRKSHLKFQFSYAKFFKEQATKSTKNGKKFKQLSNIHHKNKRACNLSHKSSLRNILTVQNAFEGHQNYKKEPLKINIKTQSL